MNEEQRKWISLENVNSKKLCIRDHVLCECVYIKGPQWTDLHTEKTSITCYYGLERQNGLSVTVGGHDGLMQMLQNNGFTILGISQKLLNFLKIFWYVQNNSRKLLCKNRKLTVYYGKLALQDWSFVVFDAYFRMFYLFICLFILYKEILVISAYSLEPYWTDTYLAVTKHLNEKDNIWSGTQILFLSTFVKNPCSSVSF